MKLNLATGAIISSLILPFSAMELRAQELPSGHATDFSSVEYFDPPHERQMKTRLSGADAQPEPGSNGSVIIKRFKLETFTVDGKPEVIVRSPECVYDAMNGVANSPGKIHLQSGAGKIQVDGVGFLWRRDGGSLIISNDVQTVIENMSALPVLQNHGPKN